MATFAISCAAPTTIHAVPTEPALPEAPLGRFMRESLNVPFAFVMLETSVSPSHRGRRVHKAASILHDAARDLVDWSQPPAQTPEAREVFFTYAQQLEFHAASLENVAADRAVAVDTLEEIRQTCNDCHHFFRPASKISPDVAYDWDALDIGGYR